MPPIRIRAVVPGSAHIDALLLWLQLDILPNDPPADTGKGFWWVAYSGAQPVAFCGLYPSAHDPLRGYLCRAGVLPAFRGQGLQRRLIDTRIRKARSLGFTSITTDTVTTNPASNNNLIASGFRMFNPESPWVGDEACYWRKRITPHGPQRHRPP